MKALPLFALVTLCGFGLGCARGPAFSYETRPGTAVERFQTIALDPRKDFMAVIETMRPVDSPGIRSQVVAALQAKGYRLVPPEQAELWLDVFTLVPGGGQGHPRSGAEGGGGRGGRGGRHGGGGGERGGSRMEGERSPERSGHEGSAGGRNLTVIVELVERSSTEMVWTGMLELALAKPGPEDRGTPAEGRIESEVKRLLEPLPARR